MSQYPEHARGLLSNKAGEPRPSNRGVDKVKWARRTQ
jgi:hypothetical protein